MTQIITDSDAGQEQTTETPVEETREPTLGSGLDEPDTFLGDSGPRDEQPDDGATAQPGAEEGAAADTQPTNGDAPDAETQAGVLRQQDYTRKTTDLADQRKAFEAERTAWLTQREEAVAAQTAAAAVPAGAQTPDLSTQIQQALMDPNLAPTERAGLQVIGNMSTELAEARATIAELKAFQVEMQPKVAAVEATSQTVVQGQNAAAVKIYAAQLKDATTAFGAEAVNASKEFIRTNIKGTNPQTGEQWTIPELVGLASGKTAAGAQAATQQTAAARGAAKRRAAPAGSHAAAEPTGTITKAQAMAQFNM
jgi:hypothetical protein